MDNRVCAETYCSQAGVPLWGVWCGECHDHRASWDFLDRQFYPSNGTPSRSDWAPTAGTNH